MGGLITSGPCDCKKKFWIIFNRLFNKIRRFL